MQCCIYVKSWKEKKTMINRLILYDTFKVGVGIHVNLAFYTIPSDTLLMLSSALVPLLNGENAVNFTMDWNLLRSVTHCSTWLCNIDTSSNSLTLNRAYPEACSYRIKSICAWKRKHGRVCKQLIINTQYKHSSNRNNNI